MGMVITRMVEPGSPSRRLLWFVALYIGGVGVVGGAAYVIRSILL